MRIAQVAPPWIAVPPPAYGGIEWVVALLADGLVDLGHDVTLFATGDSSTKAKLDFVFEEGPGPKFINSIAHDAMHTMHSLRDAKDFDVLHIHSPFSALAAAVETGVPVVHTLHGSFNEMMTELYGYVADRAWFTPISEAQRRLGPDLRYTDVVYNGIDTSLYPFRGPEEKEDFVLFVGRTSVDKGAHRAVQAAAMAGVPIVLAVKIADPEEQEHWTRDVEPILPEGTKVLGEITVEEKADLMSRARGVLFPIDWDEPFGLVMTESMACGTPVIARPRGSVPEVIADGETGFIVDTVEEIAEAIGKLGQIDAKACRRWVEERFSARSMVEGYARVFERAAAEA
ncbi:MAG: glycosyltransferase family 4 protein [Actinobacteria bacterium]|nr:glycosyltransferase family 4 protein [Actinomycetota bacterium]